MCNRLFILLVYLILPITLIAQINHALMYQAFLTGDLSYWGKTLDKFENKQLDKVTLEQVTNYEYGYIPYLQDKGDPQAKKYLDYFEIHINQLEKCGAAVSTILVYRSAAAAFRYFFNKMTLATNGMNSFKFANKSVEIDPKNPLALSLKGNVEFYCPPMFGGSKSKALEYLQKSISNFEVNGLTINNWNYVSTMLCLAQCYEKTGDKMKAIEVCRKILTIAPNHVYVRDIYYPSLQKNSK